VDSKEMIVVCTHQSPQILELFLSSYQNCKTEDHKVLIVETSESQVSKDIANNYGCLFTNSALKYEIGAYNHAIKLFPNEDEYLMIQDSFEFIQPGWEKIFRQLSCGKKLVSICNYKLTEDPCPGCGKAEFEALFNKSFPSSEAYGVLSNSFYVPQSGMKMLIDFGIEKLKAENKNDTFATERVLGAMAHCSCGYDDLSTLLGPYEWIVDRFTDQTGFTIYIQKHIKGRQ